MKIQYRINTAKVDSESVSYTKSVTNETTTVQYIAVFILFIILVIDSVLNLINLSKSNCLSYRYDVVLLLLFYDSCGRSESCTVVVDYNDCPNRFRD